MDILKHVAEYVGYGVAFIGVIATMIVVYLLVAAPGILICWMAWQKTRKLRGKWVKAMLRAPFVSFAIAPGNYGHAGIFPALPIAIFAQEPIFRETAIYSLGITWLIAIPIVLWASSRIKILGVDKEGETESKH